jgi:hypothetical protein
MMIKAVAIGNVFMIFVVIKNGERS